MPFGPRLDSDVSLYGSRLRDFNDFFRALEPTAGSRLDYFDLQRALRRLDIFVTPQAQL